MQNGNQNQTEQACYIRFFNGAIGMDTANVFVNGELMAQDLRHGAFSAFRKAKPGVYKLDVRVASDGTDEVFSELIALMEDVAYTVALAGDIELMSIAVLPLDLRQDVRLPSIRFANVMAHDTVLDINIDGQKAVTGLMFKEISENIEIEPSNHFVAVYDADDQKILEDGFAIASRKKYLGIIAGDMGETDNPPVLYISTDMPIM